MEAIGNLFSEFSGVLWGPVLLVLLLGGGLFFLIYSRFTPFAYIMHAVQVLRGKYDDPNDPGQINHFKALMSALAATVGMGNISGVAVAITTGGPGALFWMWVSAFVGVATKFFTCTLAILYRGKDSNGELQGGPMYTIVEGLGKKWRPLAIFFCIFALFGPLPIFQTNQLTASLMEIVYKPAGWVADGQELNWQIGTGIGLMVITSMVVFGGIKRIGDVAGRIVPAMVIIYMVAVLVIVFSNFSLIDDMFALIFRDAFTAQAMGGGLLGVMIKGAQRAAFSNEAGIGTAPMMHGAAKTKEPVREGLVAMLGPIIDTLIVCTLTGLAILVTGAYQFQDSFSSFQGITLTADAFARGLPGVGSYVLMICVLFFAISSMFSYSYYGVKSLGFLVGAKHGWIYNFFYVASIMWGATASIDAVVGLIDSAYALMAFPTMIAAFLLAPKVMEHSRDYFRRMKSKNIN